MVNIYKVKKWGAFILCGFIPLTCFVLGNNFYNFMIGMAFFGGGLLISVLVANILLNNPFTTMLEGGGLLAIDISSTGIMRPFICTVEQPYIKGKIGNENITDIYDRDTVLQLANPQQAGKVIIKDNKISVTLNEDEFNRARFGLFQYPVLIFNGQVKSLLTKDFLSESEKKSFAEHGILYLNRKLEELTGVVRDFGRYIVELTKPQENWFAKRPWAIWLIIIAIIIMILLFAGPVIKQFMGGIQSAAGAATGVTMPTNPVTPIG